MTQRWNTGMHRVQPIGTIGNAYGGLRVTERDSRFFWSIEDVICDNWEEIPESLYRELVKFGEQGR